MEILVIIVMRIAVHYLLLMVLVAGMELVILVLRIVNFVQMIVVNVQL